MFPIRSIVLVLATVSLAFSHPVHEHHQARDLKIIGTKFSSLVRRQTPGSELQLLVDGNDAFRKEDPELLKKLTDEGQGKHDPRNYTLLLLRG